MVYSLRNRDYSTRGVGKEYMEQEDSKTTVPKFRRMYSTNSLQAQVIPEETDMAKAKRLIFSHHKSSSDPNRFTSSTTQERNKQKESHTMTIPTLPLFLALAIITITTCYLMDYLPHLHTTHQPTQLSDYSIIWVMNSVSDKISTLLQLSSEHGWVLGPAVIGLSVTSVTLVILNIDTVGGEVVESSPSLHLGEGVAVMNGLLMFLYFLFFNIRDKTEEIEITS
eukprot:TRINITY_DN6898_c0_g1_i1.p1 TRINITY_DN6898_c0_g1~~TRINITY_DN6898_c0_g1_i1.p1  ORF type:complete len:224 (+),score=74.06 TRINITY_DN6898_c0_g1_i1:139-810(+)